MSQVKKTGPQFDQGEGGGGQTKANGSPLSPAGDVKNRGTGSHLEPFNVTTRSNGSHLDPGPNVPGSDMTSQRGGGTNREGSDRTKGSKSSGSPKQQHPNVQA